MNVQQMIALNNERRKQLDPINRAYYEDMVLFIRTRPIDRRAGEELLLEILEHIIQAQNDGRSVHALFGDDPVQYCRELVSELPKRRGRQRLSDYFIIMWGTLTWYFFAQAVAGLLGRLLGIKILLLDKVNVLELVTLALIAVIYVRLVLTLMGSSAFQRLEKNRLVGVLLVIVSLAAIFAPIAATAIFRSTLLTLLEFPVSPWVSAVLFVVGFVVQRFAFLDSRSWRNMN